MEVMTWIRQQPERFEPWHDQRYVESLAVISSFVKPGHTLLECGGQSVFTRAMRQFLPGVTIENTSGDLRHAWRITSGAYDAVIMMEVVEHLRDREESPVDAWTHSGFNNAIAEAHRVLRVGGRLFITTPNVTSLRSVQAMFEGNHPYMYEPHVREYAPRDLSSRVRKLGFHIDTLDTRDVWKRGGLRESQAVELLRVLPDPSLRGDDIFLVATKR